jgi:tetratricopeptide (TPR) repeat protein
MGKGKHKTKKRTPMTVSQESSGPAGAAEASAASASGATTPPTDGTPDAQVALLSVAGLLFIGFAAFVFGYGAYGDRAVDGLEKLCAEAAFMSGAQQRDIGNDEEAARYFREALQGRFEDPARRHMCGIALGDTLFRLERYDEALDAYRSLPPEAFAKAGSYTGYVETARRSGEVEEAERLARLWLEKADAEKNAEQLRWARYALGTLLLEGGRADEALGYFQAVAAAEPAHEANIQVARILHRQGKKDEALATLDAYLAQNPAGQPRKDAEALRGQIAGAPAAP